LAKLDFAAAIAMSASCLHSNPRVAGGGFPDGPWRARLYLLSATHTQCSICYRCCVQDSSARALVLSTVHCAGAGDVALHFACARRNRSVQSQRASAMGNAHHAHAQFVRYSDSRSFVVFVFVFALISCPCHCSCSTCRNNRNAGTQRPVPVHSGQPAPLPGDCSGPEPDGPDANANLKVTNRQLRD